MAFILGSGSPRRLELLGQIGVVPDAVSPPDIDETPQQSELPRPYCNRITREKLMAVAAQESDIVLCADTTVALGRRILGKPEDRDEAARFLKKLSGRRHRVITSVGVKRGAQIWQRDVLSIVRMQPITGADLEAYLDSNDWQGKAGGYGIQGAASAFIPWISGSFTGIVGLPLSETTGLLKAAGYPLYQNK